MSERALGVTVGVPFDVDFVAPGADYEWQLTVRPAGIELISRIFRQFSDAASGDTVLQLFHLRAAQPGLHELYFVLKRRSDVAVVQNEIVVIEAAAPGSA